ncbi:hypothetical protein ACHAXT_005712 [Thalassiosira profunda]
MVCIAHYPTDLQWKLEKRGMELQCQAYQVERKKSAHADGGNTPESFDISTVLKKKKDVAAWEEVGSMDDAAKEAEEAAIREGLKGLGRRFMSDPAFPEVPASVWDDACSDKYANARKCTGDPVEDDHIAAIQKHFPTLDRDVIFALLDASDLDRQPQECMIAIGSHFALQGWEKELLQKKLVSMGSIGQYGRKLDKLASKSYTELIVDLTGGFLYCSSSCFEDDERVGYRNLQETARHIRCIALEELKQIAKKEGIVVERGVKRPSIVLKIVEHLYSEVLEPAEGKSDDGGDTRRAKKARTSKD